MGNPNTTANVLAGPGALIASGHKDVMCEAFASAVDNFCKTENKDSRKKNATPDEKELAARRGKFNDYFYRSLASRDRALAGSIRREVGGVFRKGGRYGRYLGTIGQVARGRGVRGQIIAAEERAAASFMAGVMTNASGYGRTGANRFLNTGSDAMRGATVGAFEKSNQVTQAMRDAVYTRWSDGTLPGGQNIELKGPGDSERPGQLEDMKAMGRGKDPIVVSCENCGLDCKNGCP